jgi:DNA-binding SARP family transcriptional activator
MTRMALYLLGPPRVELDDHPVHIGRAKAIALLAYLAVTAAPHSRDALATLLWPESPRARANLRRVLVTLRQALGENWLDVQPESVALLHPAIGSECVFWLDVSAFQACLDDCQTHGHPVDQLCPDCSSLLAEAVALYRDDFLTGFTLPDSLAFDEWTFYQSERLRDGMASALQRLVRWHDEQAEFEPAIAYARRWLEMDPLHEPAHRQLMTLFAQAGHRNAALRQYRSCLRTLEAELGIPPSAETNDLYEEIRAQTEAVAPASVARTAIRAEFPAFLAEEMAALATEPPVFVARERELARLNSFLDKALAGQGQVALVTGGPGRGKTALTRTFAGHAIEVHSDLLVCRGACNAFSGVGDPYLPFRQILGALTGDVEASWSAGEMPLDQTRRLWDAVPCVVQTLLDHGPYLIDTLIPGPALLTRTTAATDDGALLEELRGWVQREHGHSTGLEQSALFTQVTNVLRALSMGHPLVLVLDDLQ